MVTLYWSADNLIWRVSVDHNMISYIKKVNGKPRLYVSANFRSMAAILHDSTVVVVRTRPRTIPLAMITIRKSTDGFPFVSYMGMGLHLAAGDPLIFKTIQNHGIFLSFSNFWKKKKK